MNQLKIEIASFTQNIVSVFGVFVTIDGLNKSKNHISMIAALWRLSKIETQNFAFQSQDKINIYREVVVCRVFEGSKC
jgi:hypothetical protein